MKNIFFTVLIVFIVQKSSAQVEGFRYFTKEFVVNVSSPKELTDDLGQSLSMNHIYKIHLVTRGTGTNTGAEYLAWYDPDISIWKTRAISINGTLSNHPILIIDNNIIKISINHPNNYTIRAFVEELKSFESDVTPHLFGASHQWQRNINNLYYLDGNVGIGTTTPSNKLEVNGTVRSKEVKVEALPWPDFVFSKEYTLRPLKEVDTYIQQHGSLPEIPTAKEVEENGISLGEMNAKLLQKIEELTLYVIEQEKTIENQNNELIDQNRRLNAQSSRINKLEEVINEILNN